jgi:hypothetical protein
MTVSGASTLLVIAQQKSSRKKEESEEQVAPAEDLMRERTWRSQARPAYLS